MSRSILLVLASVPLAALFLSTRAAEDDLRRERKGGASDAQKDALEGQRPPPLDVDSWVNTDGEALEWSALEGRVVLVKFWGTWCGPCVSSMPELQRLHEEHTEDGLAILAIHTGRSSEKMGDFMEERSYTFPACIDSSEETVKRYFVDGYPDYYLIGRDGRIIVADLANSDVVRAVRLAMTDEGGISIHGLADEERTASYTYGKEGNRWGRWTAFSRPIDDEHGMRLESQDIVRPDPPMSAPGHRIEVSSKVDEFLTPMSVVFTDDGEIQHELVAESLLDRGIKLVDADREREVILPPGGVLDVSLMRIVTRLPFEAGFERELHVLQARTLHLHRDQRIVCVGEAEIQVNGATRTCWEYAMPEEGFGARYWVSPERELLAMNRGASTLRIDEK